MRTEKVCDGVWKFKGSSCTYLILGEKNVMIDAGDFCECDELKAKVEKIVDLERIDFVLLTHLHYDHVGCVGLFPNARILASAEEIEDYRVGAKEFHYFAGVEQDEILWERLEVLQDVIEIGEFESAKSMKRRQDEQDLKDGKNKTTDDTDGHGQEIGKGKKKPRMNANEREFRKLGLEVLKVPGHTRGCVAFLDRERRLLFSGDTVFAGEVVGRTDLPNSLPEQMSWSVECLRELEREGFRVLAGHGY